MIGSIGHEFVDGSIEFALIGKRSGAEVAIVLDSIKVALLLHVLEEVRPNDQVLQGLNRLVPVSLRGLDVALLADLLVQLIEPLVQVLIVEEIEVLVVLLELYLCDFGVADVWLGRRRQFDLIDHVAEYLPDLLLQDLLLDVLVEPASPVLPLVHHKGLPAELDVRDLGLEGRLADDLHLFREVPWELR